MGGAGGRAGGREGGWEWGRDMYMRGGQLTRCIDRMNTVEVAVQEFVARAK